MANNPTIVTALDDLLMKPIRVNGVDVPTRTYLNLVGSPTFADNPTADSTDVTIPSTTTSTGYTYAKVTGPATVNAVAGAEYGCDVSAGAVIVNLPAGLALGALGVIVGHIAGSLGSNNLTVNGPAGVNIPQLVPNQGTVGPSIVLNQDGQAGSSFSYRNKGVANVYST